MTNSEIYDLGDLKPPGSEDSYNIYVISKYKDATVSFSYDLFFVIKVLCVGLEIKSIYFESSSDWVKILKMPYLMQQ